MVDVLVVLVELVPQVQVVEKTAGNTLLGGRFPCRAGRVGSTGAGCGKDNRDPTFADHQESR